MKRLIIKIVELIKYEWEHKNQRTFCYCPVCSNELNSSNSFVKDTDQVYYMCSRCGSRSVWNFDIAPAPILEKYEPISTKYIPYRYDSTPPVKSKKEGK